MSSIPQLQKSVNFTDTATIPSSLGGALMLLVLLADLLVAESSMGTSNSQRRFNGIFLEDIRNSSSHRVHWQPGDWVRMNKWLAQDRHSLTTLRDDEASLSRLAASLCIIRDRLHKKHRAVLEKKLLSSLESTLKTLRGRGQLIEYWDPESKRKRLQWPDDLIQQYTADAAALTTTPFQQDKTKPRAFTTNDEGTPRVIIEINDDDDDGLADWEGDNQNQTAHLQQDIDQLALDAVIRQSTQSREAQAMTQPHPPFTEQAKDRMALAHDSSRCAIPDECKRPTSQPTRAQEAYVQQGLKYITNELAKLQSKPLNVYQETQQVVLEREALEADTANAENLYRVHDATLQDRDKIQREEHLAETKRSLDERAKQLQATTQEKLQEKHPELRQEYQQPQLLPESASASRFPPLNSTHQIQPRPDAHGSPPSLSNPPPRHQQSLQGSIFAPRDDEFDEAQTGLNALLAPPGHNPIRDTINPQSQGRRSRAVFTDKGPRMTADGSAIPKPPQNTFSAPEFESDAESNHGRGELDSPRCATPRHFSRQNQPPTPGPFQADDRNDWEGQDFDNFEADQVPAQSPVGNPDAQGAQRASISPSIAEALSKDHEPTLSIMEALASLDMRSCGMSMTIVEALERDDELTPTLLVRLGTDSPRGPGVSIGGISVSIAKALENDHGPTPSVPEGFNNLSMQSPGILTSVFEALNQSHETPRSLMESLIEQGSQSAGVLASIAVMLDNGHDDGNRDVLEQSSVPCSPREANNTEMLDQHAWKMHRLLNIATDTIIWSCQPNVDGKKEALEVLSQERQKVEVTIVPGSSCLHFPLARHLVVEE
ncbi:hypothetical protein NM208_g6061 [Fusarium decemcellulare]|uniref:Uncharacterized protein n=1 Tax=Fusarium decemcellulare TaxID=57161 RepID=A0ACC1SEN9_9HYPO|nr:hypothetical protein NM208_g6061 [Fusarium decemcellulare]